MALSLFMLHTSRVFYNDIHRTFINIGLPSDPLVGDRVLVKQPYWLEWP